MNIIQELQVIANKDTFDRNDCIALAKLRLKWSILYGDFLKQSATTKKNFEAYKISQYRVKRRDNKTAKDAEMEAKEDAIESYWDYDELLADAKFYKEILSSIDALQIAIEQSEKIKDRV